MFHRIVGFNNLGIAVEDTEDGRNYAAVNEARQIAKERGFELITCNVLDLIPDKQKAERSCFRGRDGFFNIPTIT